jgi:putative tryptophan/tyrosine transport system substrate-binding protein
MGIVRRRHFLITACAALAAPNIVRAQAATKLPVLGTLSPNLTPTAEQRAQSPLRNRLRELGWVDGKTFLIESAFGEGREDRLPELASMLVAKKVDVIWAGGPEAAVAAARATKTIPIVFWGVPFPIEQGLVNSFARPGRNVTGVAFFSSPEVHSKRLEFLGAIAPAAKRLANISVPTSSATVEGGQTKIRIDLTPAAQNLGYELRTFPVEKPEDFEPTFAAILAWRAQAIAVTGTSLTFRARHKIADFALNKRLPSAFTLRSFVEAGGLVSYGIDPGPTVARTADYVDRILRGAKPAELSVDLPSRYEMAFNRKTATALGLTIPQSILLRADRVIE